MADAVISVATEEAVRPLLDSIATQLGYIWNYKTNFDNLKKQVHKLQDRRVALEHSINDARRQGDDIEQHVVNWLESVEKINGEATKIIDDNNRANMKCFKNVCPDLKKRYQHSKKASVKAMEVSELEKEGQFDQVSYRTPPKETWHTSSKPFKDFESRRSTVENILNELRNPNVNMVGVYGMGGIGKTTMAKEVCRQAEEQRLFDAVVFVEVSEKPDTRKIQGAIADKLGLQFREETESGRARAICERLKKESKILLILDNIWKGLDLEIVGIPFGNEHRDCKLLLTARVIEILSNDMDCRNNFPVGNLDEKEAWDLFKTTTGACIEQHNLQPLAFDVAKRCGGLPIAIVTIAKALKDKQEHEWKNALRELKRPSSENLVGSVTAEAYSCILLSYNQLNSDELKSTFLLCSIMGFTSSASVEELLRYGTGLSLFRTVYTMEEGRDKVVTLVKKLRDSSLLLDTSDSEWFSIHDVVRDVGRAIALKDHNKFTVIDDVIPREWKDKNMLKQCTSISLHDISELPNMELNCPLLHFLYMKGKNKNSKISDNFFIGMPNLRVLHLINMKLSPHPPSSLGCLVNLQTLCLNCSRLRDIGFITNTKDLEILVLSCNTIKQLPTEIGQLTQLKVLDLSNCDNLEIVPPSIISRLTQLEELYLDNGFDNWHVEGLDNESGNASLDELKHLSQLTTFRIRIRDHKIVPKGLFSQKLQRYNICIGSIDRWDHRSRYGISKTLKLQSDDNIVLEDGVVMQLKGIEELFLDGRQSIKNALYELDSDGFPRLKHFDICNNPDLVYIVDSSKKGELPCDAFPLLETLSLTNLISLEKICHGQLTPNSFCRLTTVNVDGCDNLKTVFFLSIAKHLSQLQDISVSNCKNMVDIFTIGRSNDINSNEEIDRVVLDQLHSLSLIRLPKLRSFCSEEEVLASTSNEIILEDTPMPFFDRKVQLPNQYEVNFETIRHHQLPTMSHCFQNLTDLNVRSCNNLKYLFSFSTLGSFVQLQDLEIKDCNVLEAIIRIDDLGNNELPSLKKLKIEGCPEMKAFIFNDLVSFPNLEEIQISNMKNLEMIWHNQPIKDSMNAQHCQKLCKVGVFSCPSLKNLFPPSIARNLFQLKDLNVDHCGIEEIVAKDGAEDATAMTFVFPQLTCLNLEYLQELKCFYSGIHTMECPVLKELILCHCDKIDRLFALELFAIQKNILKDQLDIPVQLPNQYEVNFETIRHHQLPTMSHCFQNLTDLRVQSCNNLKYLFSFSTLGSFVQLQDLEIKDCNVLEAIIRIDDLGNNELPSLMKKLKVEGCPEMKAFIFNDLVSFPNLEEIQISKMKNLEIIWHNQLIKDSMNAQHCQKLCKVGVSSCPSLKNLFPPSIARNLFLLKDLNVDHCGIEEIVAKDGAEDAAAMTFVFPQLTCLNLEYLQERKCFYSGIHTMECPVLKELILSDCDKIDRLFALELSAIQKNILEDQVDIPEQPLSLVEKVSSNLEKLSLDGNSSRMIFEIQFPEILFPKLKHLSIENQKSSLLLGIFQRSTNLESLSLRFSGSDKEIFWFDVVEKHTQTKKLSISVFDSLKQIWKQDSKVDVILEELHVTRCGSLVTLIPPSACFQNLTILTVSSCGGLLQLVSSSTAKSLVGLKEMSIVYCQMMTEVVADDEGAITTEDIEIINFSKLKSIHLHHLSRLTSFCSRNYRFNFPSLETLSVDNCPKMKIFASGVVLAPMLREIRLDSKGYYCEGDDVNRSMQQIHEKLVFSAERLSLSPRDSKLDLILHNLETLTLDSCNSLISLMSDSASFQNLKRLKVWNCNGLIRLLSSSTAKSLVQLEEMSISCCDMVTKIVATEDVEEDKIIIFSKLWSLTLDDLSSLASFCSGNHTLNFPSLTSLYVITCPNMKFFSLGVSSAPLLQRIQYDWDSDKSIWEEDLNTTIQWIHEELVCIG